MLSNSTPFLLAAALLGMSSTAMADKTVDSQSVLPLYAKPTSSELVTANIVLLAGVSLRETPAISFILPIQSQIPQPVLMRNYYLTPQAKKAVLPFWQGPRPVRLRNPFLAASDK